MHPLVARILEKRGVKDLTDLNKDEQATYRQWEQDYKTILAAEEALTVDKVAEFCRHQVKVVESQWRNWDISREKMERLVLVHTVYKVMLDLLEAPQRRREQLEAELTSYLYA